MACPSSGGHSFLDSLQQCLDFSASRNTSACLASSGDRSPYVKNPRKVMGIRLVVGFCITGRHPRKSNVLQSSRALMMSASSWQSENDPSGVSDSDSDRAVKGGMLRGTRKEAEFVNWFREAWPYIQGHRGSTFVIVIPGEVVANEMVFDNVLQDVALLHGLGVRIVLVPGSQKQIDQILEKRGIAPAYHGAYRVTDADALDAAMEASGRTRVSIEAKLSRGPVIPVLRRHGETDRWHDVGISVASGNFVFAKRRGVVHGVDFGGTGEVKRIDVDRIRNRLDLGCVVLLSNLGFSPSGEALNCNTFEVATLCATAIQADKLICLLDGPVVDKHGRLIRWMTLQQADLLIRERAALSYTAADYVSAVAGAEYAKSLGLREASNPNGGNGAPVGRQQAGTGHDQHNTEQGRQSVVQPSLWVEEAAMRVRGEEGGTTAWGLGKEGEEGREEEAAASLARWDAQRALYSMKLEKPAPLPSAAELSRNNGKAPNGGWNGKKGFAVGGEERWGGAHGYLSELTAAVFACRGGVRRVHLLDSSQEGSLLLELYTRDGVGSMVSSDLYEGTRAAQATDIRGIQALLQPLEEAGVLLPRSEERLQEELPYFTVVERDGHIIACAALIPFPDAHLAEIAAFAVSPAARGHGRGDNLLSYLEARALRMGLSRLFLLTTRTADWFEQRGFAPCALEELPEGRRRQVNRSRGSKCYAKALSPLPTADELPARGALPTDLPKYQAP